LDPQCAGQDQAALLAAALLEPVEVACFAEPAAVAHKSKARQNRARLSTIAICVRAYAFAS